jgi:hypothetical protein
VAELDELCLVILTILISLPTLLFCNVLFLELKELIFSYKEAYSTPILPFDILAERPPQQKFELVSSHITAFSSKLKPFMILMFELLYLWC